MLERSQNGCSADNIDDVTKTIRSSLSKLKKSTDKETKLNGLVDIVELVKVALQVSDISNEEFYNHIQKRRAECGVFVTDNKLGE